VPSLIVPLMEYFFWPKEVRDILINRRSSNVLAIKEDLSLK